MYLKLIIIAILFVIIIIFLLNNSKNEHLNIKISKDDTKKFSDLVKEYNNNDSVRTFNDIQILNKFTINDIDLKDFIINIKYPIGSYYIQYPQNNVNTHDDDNIELNDIDTMLPNAKSPEKLFGGIWEEKFNGDSVFFRTRGVLSDDTRLNGIQTYAMKNLYGWTSIAQTNLWNPGFGSQGVLEETKQIEKIKTDGKPDSLAFIGMIIGAVLAGIATVATLGLAAPLLAGITIGIAIGAAIYLAGAIYLSMRAVKEKAASDWLYNGPPGKDNDKVDGNIVAERGPGIGHQNLMDPSLQTPVSSLELRVRNRIMKVWKRIG